MPSSTAANLRTVRWIETSPRHSGAVSSRHREETAVNIPGRSIRCLALAACLVASGPVLSAKRDNPVRFAYDQAPENVDPFFNNVRIGVIIGQHVWDTLDLPRSDQRRIQGPARDRLEVGRRQDAGVRAAPGREVPQRRGVRRRRRRLHAQLRRQAGEQGRHASQRQLDRARREDRQVQGAASITQDGRSRRRSSISPVRSSSTRTSTTPRSARRA